MKQIPPSSEWQCQSYRPTTVCVNQLTLRVIPKNWGIYLIHVTHKYRFLLSSEWQRGKNVGRTRSELSSRSRLCHPDAGGIYSIKLRRKIDSSFVGMTTWEERRKDNVGVIVPPQSVSTNLHFVSSRRIEGSI